MSAEPLAGLPARVEVYEVGPRDGLQSVKATMPTADKLRWIDALHAAGVREIEVASFVPARLLPQMADAAEVVRHAITLPGLTVMALVPNRRGAEAALAAGVHKLTLPVSASAAPRLIAEVVFPTPPFWLHSAITRAGPCRSRGGGSSNSRLTRATAGSADGGGGTENRAPEPASPSLMRQPPLLRTRGTLPQPPGQPRALGCAVAYTSRRRSTVTSV